MPSGKKYKGARGETFSPDEGEKAGEIYDIMERSGRVPLKIRELKAKLSRAGFTQRSGKGSHTVWDHPSLSDPVTISGHDGHDAKPYQIKEV